MVAERQVISNYHNLYPQACRPFMQALSQVGQSGYRSMHMTFSSIPRYVEGWVVDLRVHMLQRYQYNGKMWQNYTPNMLFSSSIPYQSFSY